jgi:hypothetical protein
MPSLAQTSTHTLGTARQVMKKRETEQIKMLKQRLAENSNHRKLITERPLDKQKLLLKINCQSDYSQSGLNSARSPLRTSPTASRG